MRYDWSGFKISHVHAFKGCIHMFKILETHAYAEYRGCLSPELGTRLKCAYREGVHLGGVTVLGLILNVIIIADLIFT